MSAPQPPGRLSRRHQGQASRQLTTTPSRQGVLLKARVHGQVLSSDWPWELSSLQPALCSHLRAQERQSQPLPAGKEHSDQELGDS